jgi:branched-subunit amino acid aminotransferase/4-amino-4-deoxychorismate lyase
MTRDLFPWAWINGVSVPIQEIPHQPADHPASPMIDGTFTTTRTWLASNRLAFWEDHRDRLLGAMHYLGIDTHSIRLPSEKELLHWVREFSKDDVVLRVNIASDGVVWAVARRMPHLGDSVSLTTAAQPIDPITDRSGWKLFHQKWREAYQNEARRGAFDDVILISQDGLVLETSRSNLFFLSNDGWFTPANTGLLLPGAGRKVLLANSPIHERPVFASNLDARIDAAFVVNSVRGIQPVRCINHQLHLRPDHPELQRFSRQFEEWSKG